MKGETKQLDSMSETGIWAPDTPIRPNRLPFFYGWVVLFLSTFGVIASIPGQTVGVSVFNERLRDALGLSELQLSVAYMIGTLISALFLGWGGRLFDRSGARKASVYSLAGLAAVLLAISCIDLLASALRALPIWFGQGWLAGFLVLCLAFAALRFTGQGMVTLVARSMLGKWFDRKRGMAMSMSGVLASFAFASAPLAFESAIVQLGWQGTWRFLGLLLLLLFVPVFWALARDNPEQCGLEMDGGESGTARRVNLDAQIHRDYERGEAIRTWPFQVFSLIFALQGLLITAYTFHIFAVARELAVERDAILALFLPIAFVSVLSNLISGWLADRTRVKYLMAAQAGAIGVACWTLSLGHFGSLSWLFVLGLGTASGLFGSMSGVVWPRFFGRRHLGAISGTFMTILVVASAVGPFLFSCAGIVFGGMRSGFIFGLAAALALMVGSFWADNPQRKGAPAEA